MNSLNQLELQNIRHLCGAATAISDKITYYKTITSDQKVVKTMDQICTDATNLKTELSNML